jgi:hypothetical protein
MTKIINPSNRLLNVLRTDTTKKYEPNVSLLPVLYPHPLKSEDCDNVEIINLQTPHKAHIKLTTSSDGHHLLSMGER